MPTKASPKATLSSHVGRPCRCGGGAQAGAGGAYCCCGGAYWAGGGADCCCATGCGGGAWGGGAHAGAAGAYCWGGGAYCCGGGCWAAAAVSAQNGHSVFEGGTSFPQRGQTQLNICVLSTVLRTTRACVIQESTDGAEVPVSDGWRGRRTGG